VNTLTLFTHLFNSYTQAMNRAFWCTGPLYERPFKRKQVVNETYLFQLICYIHLNPSHHQIGNYKTYQWSSYKSSLSSAPAKIRRNEVLEWFGSRESYLKAHNDSKSFDDITDYILE